MSKVARVISQVAAVVAIVAPLVLPGPLGTAVGAIAGAISVVAGTIAQVTQKRPGAVGATNQVVVGNNMPVPYMVGRTYSGGSQVYDNSAGEKNVIRFNVNVLSAAGPIDSIESFLADYAVMPVSGGFPGDAAVTGFYNDFMWLQTRLGQRPETAFNDSVTPMPSWTSASRLSGYAAYRVAMKFDKDAKRYSGGVPQFGCIAKGVRVYDPRLDSTYPGGSGTQRWNDESTWAWSDNPALHALTYARGRFIEKNADGSPKVPPVKLLGCGLPKEAIDLAVFVEAANLCEANGWYCGGVVLEAPGASKWENLKRFCQTFAAQPVMSGGALSLRLFGPRPSLFVMSTEDLAEGNCEVRAMKPFQDRRNAIVPRVRLETHRWEHVQLAAVTNATYVAEDGEVRTEEVQYDLVQDKDQGAQLAAADLLLGRQLGPLSVTCKPRLMRYRPGEAGDVNLPELGLNNRRMVITGRQIDPATGLVTFTLESEPSLAEYDYALGRTGVAPPTPVIRGPQEIDETSGDLQIGTTEISQLIATSYAKDLTFSVAAPSGGNSAVTISNHNRVYTDKTVTVTGGTLSVPAASGDLVLIYYDDDDRSGGAVTYQALRVPGATGPTEAAYVSPANPYRHFVAVKTVPASGSSSGGTDAGSGGGAGGWSPRELNSTL